MSSNASGCGKHTNPDQLGRIRFQDRNHPHPFNSHHVKKFLKWLFVRSVVSALILSTAGFSYAQQAPSLSSRASEVKKKADQLSAGAHISVIKIQGKEQYGQFQSDDDEGFTFFDVDRNQNFTLRFEEVRTIKDGYGGRNSLHQSHTDRRKVIIVTCVTLGVIGGIIAAAASAKN